MPFKKMKLFFLLKMEYLLFANKKKAIKLPKYIYFEIARLSGLEFSYGWDIIRNKDPEEVLYKSCKINNINLCKLAIKNGAKNISAATYLACKLNHVNLFIILFDICNHNAKLCFKTVCQEGNYYLANYLLKKGFTDVNEGLSLLIRNKNYDIINLIHTYAINFR